MTNVRRAGSRPYFEWESELRWRARWPGSPRPVSMSCVLLDGSIDCGGSPSIFPLRSLSDQWVLSSQTILSELSTLRAGRTAPVTRSAASRSLCIVVLGWNSIFDNSKTNEAKPTQLGRPAEWNSYLQHQLSVYSHQRTHLTEDASYRRLRQSVLCRNSILWYRPQSVFAEVHRIQYIQCSTNVIIGLLKDYYRGMLYRHCFGQRRPTWRASVLKVRYMQKISLFNCILVFVLFFFYCKQCFCQQRQRQRRRQQQLLITTIQVELYNTYRVAYTMCFMLSAYDRFLCH